MIDALIKRVSVTYKDNAPLRKMDFFICVNYIYINILYFELNILSMVTMI
jgi:hypothetical protein